MLVIWRSLILSRNIYCTATMSDRSNLRRKCGNNYKLDEDILYYKKETDTSLMLYDSSFNGRLSHELQVQIANIYLLAIKDKIMVTALPVQQQTAGTPTCGVIAIALTYNFSCGDSSFIFVHLYCTCLQPEWINTKMIQCDLCQEWFNFKCIGICIAPDSWLCVRCK